MLYSVRMRAAQGGPHEEGGKHISGAERLVDHSSVRVIVQDMLERAVSHTRGQADFINLVIERVKQDEIKRIRLLPIKHVDVCNVQEGRNTAKALLIKAGVEPQAADNGLKELYCLPDSMRGAMIVCAETGARLDSQGMRGIRVSHMDIENEKGFISFLHEQGIESLHAREAMVLAAKVVSAPGVVAELCWSDDPEYTTGYVASSKGYIRIPHLKEKGSGIGGRVFFVKPAANILELIRYLEKQLVLVIFPKKERQR